MPDASAFERRRGRCLVCGEVLGTDPHYVEPDHLPDGEHVRCRDWTGRPFPYAAVLRQLRRRWRAIRDAASPELRARVVALGRWLAERERMWPEGATETVLEAGETLESVLAEVSAAGVSIRR